MLQIYALIHLAPEGVVNDILIGSLGSFGTSNIILPSPADPIRDDQSLIHSPVHAT